MIQKLLDKNRRIAVLPNAISLFRILISPLFVACIASSLKFFALFVLLIGSLSDFFDGYIARKTDSISKIGELLDPLADKIFINSVIWSIFLYYNHSVYLLVIAVLLSLRDIFLVIGAVYILFKKISVSIKPLYISKLCTALLFSLCIAILLFNKDNIYTQFLGYITMIIVCLSAFLYLKRANFLQIS